MKQKATCVGARLSHRRQNLVLPEVLGLSPASSSLFPKVDHKVEAFSLERDYQHSPSLSHKSPEASVEFAVSHGESQ